MLGLRGPGLPAAGILCLLSFLALLLLPAVPVPYRASYKPVIVVHGLFDSSYSFRHLLEYINEVWQGRVVVGCWRNLQCLGRENAELKAALLGLPSTLGAGAGMGSVGWGMRSPVLAGHSSLWTLRGGGGRCGGAS